MLLLVIFDGTDIGKDDEYIGKLVAVGGGGGALDAFAQGFGSVGSPISTVGIENGAVILTEPFLAIGLRSEESRAFLS